MFRQKEKQQHLDSCSQFFFVRFIDVNSGRISSLTLRYSCGGKSILPFLFIFLFNVYITNLHGHVRILAFFIHALLKLTIIDRISALALLAAPAKRR